MVGLVRTGVGKKMGLPGSSRSWRSEVVVNVLKVLHCNCQHANAAILSCQPMGWMGIPTLGMDGNTRGYWARGGGYGELERIEV